VPGALDRLQQVATDLIQKYGTSAQITMKTAGGAYDAGRMSKRGAEESTIDVIATPPTRATTMSEGNTLNYGFQTFIDAVTLEPKNLQTFIHKGIVYKILNADPIYSGEKIACYRLQIEG
jgi:hypothetical protein